MSSDSKPQNKESFKDEDDDDEEDDEFFSDKKKSAPTDIESKFKKAASKIQHKKQPTIN